MNATPHKPLEGCLVIAIEQAVSAPFCSARLADAGARVIKVERPEGDFARGYDDVARGQSSYFVWLNRGKESLVLDLTAETARATLHALIAEADVVVQNLKPGSLAKLGFGVEALRKSNPKLITCSISGYGEMGPLANRKAYDLLVQAESGLSSITGGPEEPARVGISVVDIATGATAYSAILEALLARGRTGVGCEIQVSMFDVMAEWLTVPLLHQEAGKAPKRVGLAHPSIAPYGVFATADDRPILIAIQSDREWATFCTQVLGNPAAAKDERLKTNIDRVRNRAYADSVVASAFAKIDCAVLARMLDKAEIAFATVNDMAALANHPHLRRITVGTPNGPVSYPPPAPIFVGAVRQYGDVPGLGAHNGSPKRAGNRRT